jgi:putative ABC transport system substrate-binding protein
MSEVARRTLLMGLSTTLLAPATARAQASERVHRVGILSPTRTPLIDALTAALAERGRVSGRKLLVEIRETQGDPGRAEALARELVRAGMDVIVTNVTATAMAARRATSVTPIVMLTSSFPVEGGLAASLTRPGGNVTGMTIYAGALLFGKFVQLLHDLVPSLRELGVFWSYAPPSYTPAQVAPAIDEMNRAAKGFNMNVRFWQTGTQADLGAALAAAAHAPLDALFVTTGLTHALPEARERLVRFVVQRRLPALTDFAAALFAAGGAVLAYSVQPKELVDRTADFVDRILKGTKPAALPIEQPAKYELVVNLKAARAIGLDVPRSLLIRADRVIDT